jgi:CheY-like chemotaxis protein
MKTILVVDDNDKHRIFFKRALQSEGYIVIEASNGIEALRILHDISFDIDVVTLDYSMPKMNGAELLKIIRNDEKIKEIRKMNNKKPYIPVIVITIFITSDDVKEMKKDADECIPKPLSYKDILKAVKKYS